MTLFTKNVCNWALNCKAEDNEEIKDSNADSRSEMGFEDGK